MRAAGEAALRQLQHQSDVQRRQLEAELDRRVQEAAEQQRTVTAAHQAHVHRLEVRACLPVVLLPLCCCRLSARLRCTSTVCEERPLAPAVPLLLPQAEHAGYLRELQLRVEVAEQLVQRRDVETQAANEQLREQAAQIAVSECMGGPPA